MGEHILEVLDMIALIYKYYALSSELTPPLDVAINEEVQ